MTNSKTPSTHIFHQYIDNSMEIRDEGDFRSLYFRNEQLQSRMSLSDPHDLVLSYTRYMAFPLLMQRALNNILIIGIGSGSFVRFFHHHFPLCQIDAVDYSSKVIKSAKGYFMLPENSQISIYCADGYDFLQTCTEAKYDLILVDAFDDKGMSKTIYTENFLSICSKQLSTNGCISINLWSNDKKKLADIKTILSLHFPGRLYLSVPDRGNVVTIALTTQIPWEQILQKDKQIRIMSETFHINFRQLIKVAKQSNMPLGRRLTSVFN